MGNFCLCLFLPLAPGRLGYSSMLAGAPPDIPLQEAPPDTFWPVDFANFFAWFPGPYKNLLNKIHYIFQGEFLFGPYMCIILFHHTKSESKGNRTSAIFL